MLELPAGTWRRITANTKDLSRLADAAERLVEEVRLIREALEDSETEER